MQMSVKDLRSAIKDLPDDLPVYFRRIAPFIGNIEEAGSANLDKFASFGSEYPCLIIEPMKDDDEDETEHQLAVDLAAPSNPGDLAETPNR